MDPSTLEQNLTDALTQVIADEATLQAAIDAVKNVVSVPVTPAPADPAWTAVQADLVANGWTAPVAPETTTTTTVPVQ